MMCMLFEQTTVPKSGIPQHDVHYWVGENANKVLTVQLFVFLPPFLFWVIEGNICTNGIYQITSFMKRVGKYTHLASPKIKVHDIYIWYLINAYESMIGTGILDLSKVSVSSLPYDAVYQFWCLQFIYAFPLFFFFFLCKSCCKTSITR